MDRIRKRHLKREIVRSAWAAQVAVRGSMSVDEIAASAVELIEAGAAEWDGREIICIDPPEGSPCYQLSHDELDEWSMRLNAAATDAEREQVTQDMFAGRPIVPYRS